MGFIKKLSLALSAVIMASAVTSCGIAGGGTSCSVTASGSAEKYAAFLEERLCEMPESLVLAGGADTAKYGVDMSDFPDNEGYSIRAKDGEVIILAKTDAGLDRAVRHYALYGNPDEYTFTYGEKYRVKSLLIAGNPISEYAVVRPDDDGDAKITSASADLVKYIQKACGVSLPQYTESEYAAADKKPARTISFGIDYPALGDEGYTIEVKEDGNLSITGGRYRGCLYGVFGLMRDVGWRFVVGGGYNVTEVVVEYIHEADVVDLTSEINRTEMPDIPNRNISSGIFQSKLFRVNENEYGTVNKACHGLQNAAHIFTGIYDFNSEGRQPCFTDEEILGRIENMVVDRIEDAVRSGRVIGKDFTNVDVAQFDTGSFCQCSDCMEVYAYDGVSGCVLQMTNRMADAAKETAAKYSDEPVYVTMLAYAGTNTPPGVTVPRDNVKISYCFYVGNGMMCCTNHCISGENCTGRSNKIYAKEFDRWTAISKPGTMQVWYYPMNCYQVGYMNPHNDVIYEDMKYLVEHNIDCIMYCAGGDYNGIQLTLALEMAWNADITLDEYNARTAEYFDILYGSAGESIYHVNEMLIEASDAVPCFTGFHTRPDGKINKKYAANTFDEIYNLLKEEKRTAETETIDIYIDAYLARIIYGFIGVLHEDWYVNGTDEQRALVEERYREMHALFRKYNYYIYDDYLSREWMPAECDPSIPPFKIKG